MIARMIALLLIWPCAVSSQDILILGEVHDNPAHHLEQAALIAALKPAALVFEMLTPAQADGSVLPKPHTKADLEQFLGWRDTGWPDFVMYYPVFDAAPNARVYGAGVPRKAVLAAVADGPATTFGDDAARFGLDRGLPEDQQSAREALQMAAHCNALPPEMLPGMVNVQRLRDATLARGALRAMVETGGPVAVITGNGHARRDWGVPAYLARAAPDLTVISIGQTEDDAPLEGGFDRVLSSVRIHRPDPCDAFK